jgi:hypothetical protein
MIFVCIYRSSMELYIGLAVFLICLIIFIYIKLRYPFWNLQPAFHSYDFWRYYTRLPFIIQPGYPLKTKYVDTKVRTRPFLDISNDDTSKMADLLQCYYISSDKMLTLTDASNIYIELTGQSHPSFVSFYEEDHYVLSPSIETGEITLTNSPDKIGCMSSRAIRLYIWDKWGKIHDHYAYYWDHICVHRDFESKHLARNIIQSHERYQRIHNPDIPISFFKKEINLCEGIVPLVKYKLYTFPLHRITPPPLPDKFHIARIVQENVDLLSDLLYRIVHQETVSQAEFTRISFGFCAFPEMSVLDSLIRSGALYVYVLRKHKHPYGYFFFKNTRTSLDTIDDGNVLDCIGCITNIQGNVQDAQATLFAAFLCALYDIQQNVSISFKVLVMHILGHNHILLERWRWKYAPLFINDAAYYLYNSVFPGMPIPSEQCVILL